MKEEELPKCRECYRTAADFGCVSRFTIIQQVIFCYNQDTEEYEEYYETEYVCEKCIEEAQTK